MKKCKFFVLILSTLMLACAEKDHGPLVDGFGVPGVVGNVKVENLPGAARISYTLPHDRSLLYITAEYTNTKGESVSVNSSAFKNYILLEGFGEEREYEIELYSISKSEERSSPVKVLIHPTTPPVQLSMATLDVNSAFGGVSLNFLNELRTDFIVYTMLKDENGNWVEYDRIYTGAEFNTHYVRNLPPVETEFAFYFRDKWHNYSDTSYHTLTPMYEEELDASLFRDVSLIDDFNERLYANNPVTNLWNGQLGNTHFFQNFRDYPEKAGMPNWITIDLGKQYVLGRMKTHMVQHANNWLYSSCTPKMFEVWGSNEATTDWDKWELLGDFTSIRPSGDRVGAPYTDDDMRQVRDGEDFEFDEDKMQPVRYIRFKTVQTWGNTGHICLLLLTFWGQAVD